MVGLVAVAATSPYFGLNLMRGLKKHYAKKTWRKFYHSLNYLDRRGYVKILGVKNDKIEIKITRKGESVLELVDIDSMKLPRDQQWDGKWKVVIFDVPNNKNHCRSAFTDKLKELGFVMVQKSVWAYPLECYKEIMILRKFYEIEKYVTYFEAVEIEDELHWRGKFNLKYQDD